MNSKVQELGVFTLGVGVIITALTVYVLFMGREPPGTLTMALAVLPGAMTALMGGLVLATRSKLSVVLALGVVSLFFGLDALLAIVTMNVIRAGITGAMLYVLRNRGLLALQEASGNQPKVEKLELPFEES